LLRGASAVNGGILGTNLAGKTKTLQTKRKRFLGPDILKEGPKDSNSKIGLVPWTALHTSFGFSACSEGDRVVIGATLRRGQRTGWYA
jgi:hypothetical protein